MRKALRMALLSLAIGAIGYCVYFQWATRRVEKVATAPDAELQWLKQEFSLNDEQFTRVSQLHAAYRPKCDAMCAKLAEVHGRIDALWRSSNGSLTPELNTALAEFNAVELECQQGMVAHVFAVSREMSPAKAERYRKMMEDAVLHRTSGHNSLVPTAH